MTILGIDPGIALTGWGIIKKGDKQKLIDYGCVKTSKSEESSQRLLKNINLELLLLKNSFLILMLRPLFLLVKPEG